MRTHLSTVSGSSFPNNNNCDPEQTAYNQAETGYESPQITAVEVVSEAAHHPVLIQQNLSQHEAQVRYKEYGGSQICPVYTFNEERIEDIHSNSDVRLDNDESKASRITRMREFCDLSPPPTPPPLPPLHIIMPLHTAAVPYKNGE